MNDTSIKCRVKNNLTYRFSISIIEILAIFAVSFFVYFDFNIRMIYGYGVFVALTLLYLCSIHCKVHLSYEKVILIFLASMISFFIFFRKSKEGTVEYAIGMDLCAFIALFYEPKEKQYFKALNIFFVFSIIFSIYAIIVFSFPNFYQLLITPLLSEGSIKYNAALLRDGYGVALGANVAFMDYIVAVGLIFSLSCFFAGHKLTKSKLMLLFCILICFIGMLCVNRKGELLALLLTILLLYREYMKSSNKKEKKKIRYAVLFVTILAIIAIIYLAQKGYLFRFYSFFNKIKRNLLNDKVDITSGRLVIWKYALELCKQRPILGIGWENFSAVIPSYEIDTVKVHNNFIQIFCETGLVGFVLIVPPMLLLLALSYRYMKNYSYSKYNNPVVRIAYTTSFGIQFFFFILDFIDPCIYKMCFWPIYTVAIMSLIFARTYEKYKPEMHVFKL